jgi:GR25 family glycosyltransferase involved in LPS biosynthesis
MNISIFVLNYKNSERKQKMIERCKNFHYKLVDGIEVTNDYLLTCENINSLDYPEIDFKNFSCMLGHLKILKDFYYNSINDYAIIMEDDVYLHNNFINLLPNILKDFEFLKLDILLLSYLINIPPNNYGSKIHENLHFNYYSFHNELWGTQMYLVTKNYSKFLIDKYKIINKLENKFSEPFSADWTITKNGKRALLYPPLAVEEGEINSTHQGQINFHRQCKNFLYNENYD